MRFACIRAEEAHFPVKLMCRCLEVSRSGYYAWRVRPESARTVEDRRLLVEIHRFHKKSRHRYGSPRVHADLAAAGDRVGRKRVARLMRAAGLRAKRKRKYLCTTDSRHSLPAAPNLLNRNFSPEKPNQLWAGDITYIPTGEGWLMLATVLDLFSRRVVGWTMDRRLDRTLTLGALSMAIRQRRPGPGLIVHSDRGRQYASAEYRALLAKHGLVASMSRLANCWDNAVAESFFATLKAELVNDTPYKTRAEAKSAVFEWIEAYYNRQRRHSTLRYMTPVEYEMKQAAA